MAYRSRLGFGVVAIVVIALALAHADDLPRWRTNYGYALDEARASRRPVLVDVVADWCEPCKRMDKEVFTDRDVVSTSQRFILLKIDADLDRPVADRLRVHGVPTLLLLDPWGTILVNREGFTNAVELAALMRRVPADFSSIAASYDALGRNPADADALVAVGRFFAGRGFPQIAREFLSRAEKSGGSRVGAAPKTDARRGSAVADPKPSSEPEKNPAGRTRAANENAESRIDGALALAARYVSAFEDALHGIVAEEHYTQVLGRGMMPKRPLQEALTRREVVSDFLLVKVPSIDIWMPFRDAFTVDGKPVRDRDDRLTRLFLQPPTTAIEQARAIAVESARYNLGPFTRTTNVPVLGLVILRAENQQRFRFSRGHADAAGLWQTDFVETGRPTLIRTNQGEAVPMSGRIWIDPSTGQVRKTEIEVSGGYGRVTTTFAPDDDLGVALPVEMEERVYGSLRA